MRVVASKSKRVSAGDQVIVRGTLPKHSTLGRLYVFAKTGDMEFAPYVANVASIPLKDGYPQMLSPLSLRLSQSRPQHEVSFTSDLDGYIQVMQEVDDFHEPRASVKIKRVVNPDLPWAGRMVRHITGLFA